MGSELDNARQALAHIRRAIVECHAGARLIDVDDGTCLDDEAEVHAIETVEAGKETAICGLAALERLARDWITACEVQAIKQVPLTEGADDE